MKKEGRDGKGGGDKGTFDFVEVDHERYVRTGVPEVIFCQGKSIEQIVDIFGRIAEREGRVLATRASAEAAAVVMQKFPMASYSASAKILTLGSYQSEKQEGNLATGQGYAALVCAGTSDIPVAEEAALTLEFLGSTVRRFYDVGVAGLHRLLNHKEALRQAQVLIVIAGMEGALPSVVGGLVASPVVAVPTSVGYGTGIGGIAALLTMLNSCAPGVVVVNIDNGFGAAVHAHKILKRGWPLLHANKNFYR